MSLTYLGHSAVRFQIANLSIYVDPYFKDPVDWTKLPKGDLVIFSHGHFDHGILATLQLWEAWQCSFVGPRELIAWMLRKYRKIIPRQFFIALAHNETTDFRGVRIQAVPAHHPVNRLGKTILTVFARSSAPGKPVNGYFFAGYYHAGDTIYLADIAESLRGRKVHTACLPIGGKYGVAAPKEALRIAEEIGAQRIVPLHWQPLVEQVPFRYQSSDLVRLGKTTKTKVSICALAIGEVLELDAAVDIPT